MRRFASSCRSAHLAAAAARPATLLPFRSLSTAPVIPVRCVSSLTASTSASASRSSCRSTTSSPSTVASSLRHVPLAPLVNPLAFCPLRSQMKHRAVVAATGCRSMSTSATNTNLDGTSAVYLEEMFASWQKDPESVHKSWDVFFRTGSYTAPPRLVPDYAPSKSSGVSASTPLATSSSSSSSASPSPPISGTAAKVASMVRAFQVRGHLLAKLDPLGLEKPRTDPKELALETFGFTEADLDTPVNITSLDTNLKGFLARDRGTLSLREIYKRLQETYTQTIGYEYMHIPSVEQCNWLRDKIETKTAQVYSKDRKAQILSRLTWADHFEVFCGSKYGQVKRFGLEGGESTIPGMKAVMDKAAELGMDTIVMGMPHRGRMNVLSTVIRKPMEQIFSEFQGGGMPDDFEGTGDVKYHLGMSLDRPAGPNKTTMHLSLLANPSHLEAVDPVVCGKVRAKQFYKGDSNRSKTLGLLLHGDAAFSAQGVVYETMGLQKLPDYTIGGVIHIVVNNQVGFTTDPSSARSSPYCTDLAKAFNAPIFHVNGDDPEAVVQVSELAAEWRVAFQTDVVIDLVCYRKRGHNELDEPGFTQPQMYAKIKAMPTSLKVYTDRLLAEGTVTQADVTEISTRINKHMNERWELAKTYKPQTKDWLSSRWKGFKPRSALSPVQTTGVDLARLRRVGEKLTAVPAGFEPHKTLKTILAKKRETMTAGEGLDWSSGEALAFGTLLDEGKHVRLSGQDVERGTFSHRHAVWNDFAAPDRKVHVPLQHIRAGQAPFSISNSSLSEFGVMGFELGYSLEDPNSLVIWEAQFGDFVNGAQVIIDQFLSSGEDKWLRQSGLVLQLPHGMEGQGPEHSSARLERFLQNTNDLPDVIPAGEDSEESKQIQSTNWQVVVPSTPANIFHVLRRQLYREFRKPLILMTPKYLLRHPLVKSSFADMAEGTRFSKVYPDSGKLVSADKVRRVIYCSGKVYYDLLEYRIAKNITDVALVRIEQIAPFPFSLVSAEALRYPNAEVVWAQEESMNMGAWTYVNPRIETALKAKKHRVTRPRYVGRGPSAAPATGSGYVHVQELKALLEEAFAK